MVPGPWADGGVRCLQSDREGHAADSGDQEDCAEVRGGEKSNVKSRLR